MTLWNDKIDLILNSCSVLAISTNRFPHNWQMITDPFVVLSPLWGERVLQSFVCWYLGLFSLLCMDWEAFMTLWPPRLRGSFVGPHNPERHSLIMNISPIQYADASTHLNSLCYINMLSANNMMCSFIWILIIFNVNPRLIEIIISWIFRVSSWWQTVHLYVITEERLRGGSP
jgi:hypothetical protein